MSKKKALFLLTVLLLSAGSAFANNGANAGAGAHAGTELHESILTRLTWPAINFAIYLVIVTVIYRKKGAPALREWRDSLKGTLEKSGQALQAAERELASIRLRFSNIEEEKRLIKQRLVEEGDRIAVTITDAARVEAKKIESDTSAQRVHAFTRLQRELSLELVTKAVARAEAILRAGVTAEDDRRLRDEVLSAFIGGSSSGVQK